jgi:hypothetical protein
VIEQLANRHVLIVGGPGYGKTTAEIKELVEEAKRGDTAVVCMDPHAGEQGLGTGFFAHLCDAGQSHRVVYDQLSNIRRVPMWDFLVPSKAESPRERQAANQTRCDQFAEILLRRRGQESAASTPSIEEWLLAALNLYIYQRRRRPLADLRYAFSFEHPSFQDMLADCRDADTRSKFERLVESRQTAYQGAERLINSVCGSVAFQVRTEHDGGFNFERHLEENGIVIIEGGVGDTLSPEAMRAMMGAILLKTLNYLRKRQREFPYITLALDEANNANLIGEAGHEVRALAELRKYGLGMHILVQYLDFPSSRIEKGVLATCATRKYFNCSEPSTAARLGADLGGSYQTDGTTRRYYKDGTTWDAPDSFDNPYADELRNLKIGECLVRRGSSTTRERISPLPNPFPDYSARTRNVLIQEHIIKVTQRPEYYSPCAGDEPPPVSDSPPPPGGHQNPDDSPFEL